MPKRSTTKPPLWQLRFVGCEQSIHTRRITPKRSMTNLRGCAYLRRAPLSRFVSGVKDLCGPFTPSTYWNSSRIERPIWHTGQFVSSVNGPFHLETHDHWEGNPPQCYVIKCTPVALLLHCQSSGFSHHQAHHTWPTPTTQPHPYLTISMPPSPQITSISPPDHSRTSTDRASPPCLLYNQHVQWTPLVRPCEKNQTHVCAEAHTPSALQALSCWNSCCWALYSGCIHGPVIIWAVDASQERGSLFFPLICSIQQQKSHWRVTLHCEYSSVLTLNIGSLNSPFTIHQGRSSCLEVVTHECSFW